MYPPVEQFETRERRLLEELTDARRSARRPRRHVLALKARRLWQGRQASGVGEPGRC
jgi:hypothetical protein